MPSRNYKHHKHQGYQKGYKPTGKTRIKLAKSLLGNKNTLGHKLSKGHKEMISLSCGGNGITIINSQWRLKGSRYKKWRMAVFERDNWTCQFCRNRGLPLEAHHIKGWAKYPKLRYEIKNGVTLCVECHKLTRKKK